MHSCCCCCCLLISLLPRLCPIRTGSYVAEVTPGDVLIVPPFWFHHVETLKESVSVNVWSDAPEYALLNDM